MANISIDVAHRLKNTNKQGTPQMIVKLSSLDDKLNILKFANNLKDTGYAISSQLPKDMQERRSAQLGMLKTAKENNPGVACKLVNDKLIVGQRTIDPKFELNPLTPKAGKNFADRRPISSNVLTEKGSKFHPNVAPTDDH